VILACLGLVLVLVALVLALVRCRSSTSRLPASGVVSEQLPGLSAVAEVLIDDRGIAHVRAATERDAWVAHGYVQARDRFFQMELSRRAAAGRLAEVFGEPLLGQDRRARVWRIVATARRQATLLDALERGALEAYATGVNAALVQYGRWIAPETWCLGVDPEPWRPEDSLAIFVMHELDLSAAMGRELERGVQLARLGRKRALDLWGWTPAEERSWIPAVGPSPLFIQDEDSIAPAFHDLGSNSWVVGGGRTVSGRPLLANDSHLRLRVPGTWAAVHLEAPGLHVAGVSLPGVPGVVIGHTEGVAWGLTTSTLDDQDLFRLGLDATRASERIDGTWRQLRTVTEEIRVLGRSEPELLKVRLSERGPLVREATGEELALSWTGHFGPSPVGAFLRMNRAQTVAAAAAAWENVVGPSLNLVAADTDGRVMHHVVGMVPMRGRGAGRLPAPGADSQWAWQGFLPLATNPHRLDPAEGYVSAASQDLFAEGDYAESERFPGEFAEPWRGRRIRALIGSRDDWDVARSMELLGDTVSGQARAMLMVLRPDLERHGGSTAQTLLGWDGRMGSGSLGAHVYSRLVLELGQQIGGDESLRVGLPASPFGPSEILRLLAGGMDESWWDDVFTRGVESRQEVIDATLDLVDGLRLSRTWGEVHTVEFAHPLRDVPLLGPVLGRPWSRGPLPVAGDGTTVNAQNWTPRRPFQVEAGPSMRFVADVGDWDATVLVLAVGQSGRPWSPHYADQLQPWLEVRAQTFPFSAAAVDGRARSRLHLVPE